jgi:hypothetical protein
VVAATVSTRALAVGRGDRRFGARAEGVITRYIGDDLSGRVSRIQTDIGA